MSKERLTGLEKDEVFTEFVHRRDGPAGADPQLGVVLGCFGLWWRGKLLLFLLSLVVFVGHPRLATFDVRVNRISQLFRQ